MADTKDSGKPSKDEVDAKPSPKDETDAGGWSSGHSGALPPLSGEDRYRMNHSKRGFAIIINNTKFDPQTRMSERKGSDLDASNLYQQFKALGFDATLLNNIKSIDMQRCMDKAGAVNHSDCDCFVVAILSHGDDGIIYGTDNTVAIENLIEPFRGDRCPSLAGKPKLFFIQACRGQGLDAGVEVCDSDDTQDETDAGKLRRIPSMADFLLAYSVVPGFFSWRNSAKGSWFIQALCQVLEKYGKNPEYDILRMMTRVNKIVAYDFESNAASYYMTRKKQIPSIVSMLTKDLYFTSK